MGNETNYWRTAAQGRRAAWIRGSLWVGIAMATDFRHSWSEIRQHGLADWFSIVDSVTGCVLAGLIAARLYIDQSFARLTNGGAPPPAEPSTGKLSTLG